MTQPGVADTILNRLFQSQAGWARFARVDRHASLCEHGVRSLLAGGCMTSLSGLDLRNAGYCPWSAFAKRVDGAAWAGTHQLPHCTQAGCEGCTRHLAVANCSAAAPADVVALHLATDRRPERPVDLHSSDVRHLPPHSASYQMVATLMYTSTTDGEGHYVAVVRDPAGGQAQWICYDANSNGGVGWRTSPPAGLSPLEPPRDHVDPRALEHGPNDPFAPKYWPVALLYVRLPPTRSNG